MSTTKKYIIQSEEKVWTDEKGTSFRLEWFDAFEDVDAFGEFDSFEDASGFLFKAKKLKGDKFRIIERTQVITEIELFQKQY